MLTKDSIDSVFFFSFDLPSRATNISQHSFSFYFPIFSIRESYLKGSLSVL